MGSNGIALMQLLLFQRKTVSSASYSVVELFNIDSPSSRQLNDFSKSTSYELGCQQCVCVCWLTNSLISAESGVSLSLDSGGQWTAVGRSSHQR